MDWISELPKEIKHHIINLLPEKDRVRTIVLSKSWKLLGDSRPILVFRENPNPTGIKFFDYLDQSLGRFAGKGVFVEELKLSVSMCPWEETVGAVSRWIRFATGTNLKVLTLTAYISRWGRYRCNELLDALSSSGTLATLHLSGFEFALTTPRRSWKLPRLKSLSLDSTTLNSASAEDLISSCPSLEELQLSQLTVPKNRLELSGLGNLKRFKAELDKEFHKISIQGATSLESFTYDGKFLHFYLDSDSDPSLAEIELGGCEATLKELRILRTRLSSQWFESKISKFPNLNVLTLTNLDIDDRAKLKISSSELKELFVIHLGSLASDLEICAPNLRKLEIRGHLLDSFVISQSLGSVNLRFPVTKDINKYLLYDKLQNFFYKIRHINNVMVCFVCFKPKIAIVHEGYSDNLLDTLCDLYDLMSRVDVIISSDRDWDQILLREYEPNRIYIASSLDNNSDHLSEYLVKELTSARRNRDDICEVRYVESIEIETEKDKPEFGDEVDSQHALLQVYSESSFRLTRFVIAYRYTYLPTLIKAFV